MTGTTAGKVAVGDRIIRDGLTVTVTAVKDTHDRRVTLTLSSGATLAGVGKATRFELAEGEPPPPPPPVDPPGTPAPEVQAAVDAYVSRTPAIQAAIEALKPTAANVEQPAQVTQQQVDDVLAAARAAKPTPLSPAVEAALAAAGQAPAGDDVTPKQAADRMIAKVRAERAAERAIVCTPPGVSPSEADLEAVAEFATQLAEQQPPGALQLVAQFYRPVTNLMVLPPGGDEDTAIEIDYAQAPETITIDDYRHGLDLADLTIELDHPGWALDAQWQVMAWGAEVVTFCRPIRRVTV